MTQDCPACHGSGAGPVKTDPKTGRGYADDCGHCGGRGIVP